MNEQITKQKFIGFISHITDSIGEIYSDTEYPDLLVNVKELFFIYDGTHYSNIYREDGELVSKKLKNLRKNLSLKSIGELAVNIRAGTSASEPTIFKLATIIVIVCTVYELSEVVLSNEMNDLIIALYMLKDFSGSVDDWIESYDHLPVYSTDNQMSHIDIPKVISELEDLKIVTPSKANTYTLAEKFSDDNELIKRIKEFLSK